MQADRDAIRELIIVAQRRHGMTVRDLAKAAGLSHASIAKARNKQVDPSAETLRRLAPWVGKTEDEMLVLGGYKSPALTNERSPSRDELLERFLAADAIEVPVYDIEASATLGRHLIADTPDDYRFLPARTHYRRGRVRAIRINGRCMEPALHDGDEVFIDTQAEHQDGQPVLAVVGDALHIKRLTSRGDGWALAPENGGGEIVVDDSVHVLGVVIGVWRQLAL